MLGPRQKQLVDALRSGRFIQGTGFLQSVIDDDSSYCCLGVACKVAEENDIIVNYDSYGRLSGGTLLRQIGVKNWFGFRGNTGKALEGIDGDLPYLNDHVGLNFSKIADIIEENADIIFTEPL